MPVEAHEMPYKPSLSGSRGLIPGKQSKEAQNVHNRFYNRSVGDVFNNHNRSNGDIRRKKMTGVFISLSFISITGIMAVSMIIQRNKE